MTRKHSIFVLFFLLLPMSTGLAQNPVAVIEALDIDIWPDYDRPSVLVLLTGTLPENTRLPANVTLPLPEAAWINAVARIDPEDGNMKDDIFSSTDLPGKVTFITPDLRFRVEYYLPYTVNENRHSFDYTWRAAVGVNYFQLRVQRPISASSLKTEPDTANIVRRGDGFDYHVFAAQAVPSGQSFSVHVDYEMTAAGLSITHLQPQNTDAQTSVLPDASSSGTGMNWALAAVIAGGLIIIAVLIWQIASQRSSPKSMESRVSKRSQAKFCPNCGEPIDEGDRFCRGCGSEL